VLSLVATLTGGGMFLGRHEVTPVGPGEAVGLLDFELPDEVAARWLRATRLQHPERFIRYGLRGRQSAFSILDAATREAWAARFRIRGVRVLIVDCLEPLGDALGLDKNKDMGRLLVTLDELARDAGIAELLIVHHFGHEAERAKGDSSLLRWPDALWKIVTDDDGGRYFEAFGRDVDQPQQALALDHEARTLTADPEVRRQPSAGGRNRVPDEARRQRMQDAVAALRRQFGEAVPSHRAALAALPGHTRAAVREAVDQLAAEAALLEPPLGAGP
jgi:AAA domain